MNYCHTQKAPLHLLLHGVGVTLFVGAWLSRDEWPGAMILVAVGSIMILAGFMFAQMTVRDEGEFLAIRYGPLPVFRHRIRYVDVTSVEPDRSSIIDGWGIHWIPGRGWIYNLWGFSCAKLTVEGKTVRIGSDEVDDLVGFLRTKVG